MRVLPDLIKRRSNHSSFVIDNRFLFVLYGYRRETCLHNTIEWIDLKDKNG